ncbi:MAG: hypothetical protein ABSE45_07565 [Candidatus Acidiferrales bacterium]|jgi:hypothetical protein
MERWRKTGLIGVGGCFLLLLIVALGKFLGTESAGRGTHWNSAAIGSACAGIRVQELDPTHAAVIFLYDLDNKTDADYELDKGPNVVIMGRLKPGGTLSSAEQVSLNSAAFVPARNQTRIALEIVHPFNWPAQKDAAAERDFNQLVASDSSNLLGFVLFDQTNRYQIELPAAWPGAEQAFSK